MSELDNLSGGEGCAVLILLLAIIFGGCCFMGWLLMIVLAAFNVKLGFWICVALWVVLSALLGGLRASNK